MSELRPTPAPTKKKFRTIVKDKKRQLRKIPWVVPNELLASLIGSERRPKFKVVFDVWEYIRKRKLYNEQADQVEADEKLLPIFLGRKTIRRKDVAKYVILNVRPAFIFSERSRLGSVLVGGAIGAAVGAVVGGVVDVVGGGNVSGSIHGATSYSLPGKPTTGLPAPDDDELEEKVEVEV